MWLKWLQSPDNHLPYDNVFTMVLFREVWENTIQHSSGLSLQYLRMLDGIFPYLPQKNHGNLSLPTCKFTKMHCFNIFTGR